MHVMKGNSLDHTGYACAQVALVKLFRLLRLARRLRDIESGIADGDHAITGS